ncbi:hypothetical protein [Streptomyces sp. S.PNR 29]|uniref:hypothetical protein n=1 Tax=Streptomyces sp. S.PNR 29 TaxID=2973805 RepID=UPI0025B122CB|nr:hypothetical protein [Streptomyces sp. S.PNR 29]MDN0194379.1 hypothetical protein [Streptomyces sp. S.PNR 29]
MQLIRALRDTQLEQGKTLEEHGKLLGALVSGQVALMQQVGTSMEHLGITPPEQSPGE